MAYIREDEADIRFFCDVTTPGELVEVGDGNSWATYAGGALTAAGSKTRPGGMGPQTAQGGPATRGDVTLTIQNSDTLQALVPALEARVGKGACRVSVQYLDGEGVAIPGAQFIRTGKLKEATPPGQNYDSPNIGFFTVVIDADEL